MSRTDSATLVRCSSLIAATLLLAACATVRVGSDYDPTADFSRYHAFAWMSPHTDSRDSANPLVVQRAHDAIEASLQAKGYRLASDAASADFVVDYTIGSHERTNIASYPEPYRGPWFSRRSWWGAPYWGNRVDVYQYREGTLSIDTFDARSHRPVWHGWARKQLTRSDMEHSAGAIRQTVDAVLAKFPPGREQKAGSDVY